MRQRLLVLITVLCGVLVMACRSEIDSTQPPYENATITHPLPNSDDGIAIPTEANDDTGVFRGRIISALTTEPLSNTVVAFAQVTRKDGESVIVLNTVYSPMNVSDVEGYFIVPNAPPGEFVMVVGDPYETHEIIKDPTTQMAQTYFVEQGRVTEVGEIKVDIGK